MDNNKKRATAVAIKGKEIVSVGDLVSCTQALPNALVVDLSDSILMPGFIDPHNHPIASGISTMPPSIYIAPWIASTWDEILEIFQKKHHETPAEAPLIFFGFDALAHQHPSPTKEVLDEIFGDRMVAVLDNSYHAVSVTSAVLKELDFLNHVPEDPEGAHFLRNADGSLTGQGVEASAIIALLGPIAKKLKKNPLIQAAQYYSFLAKAGFTYATDMAYIEKIKPAYEILALSIYCPLRIGLYHLYEDLEKHPSNHEFNAPQDMLEKLGVKIIADGSYVLGNIAVSFSYLDNPTTQVANITPGPRDVSFMDYDEKTFETMMMNTPKLFHGYTEQNSQKPPVQLAIHVNGDLSFDVILKVCEKVFKNSGLEGKDHRWRIEHLGGAQKHQFKKGAELGLHASMFPCQFYNWGDLVDGKVFDSSIGASWQKFRTAFDAGMKPSFHNDGAVSPPSPLLNVQIAVTRKTRGGVVRGPEEAISLDEALAASTINAAYAVKKDHVLGSIQEGKWADFVVLSQDPYCVAPEEIGKIQVLETWVNGNPTSTDLFIKGIASINPSALLHLNKTAMHCGC